MVTIQIETPPPPQGAQRRKDEKEIEWLGVEGRKRKQPKTQRKEGGQSEEELHPLVASKQAFRATTGGRAAHGGDSCTQVLAGRTGTRGCQLKGKQAGLATEGRGLVLVSFLGRAGKNRAQPREPGQAQFPPTRRILSCAWETHLARILMPWARSSELSAQRMVPRGNKTLG